MISDQEKSKIGYPCVFSESPDDAVGNLLRLILKQECGYDEGAAYWAATITDWLESDCDLSKLSDGTAFSSEQWRHILMRVAQALAQNGQDLQSKRNC